MRQPPDHRGFNWLGKAEPDCKTAIKKVMSTPTAQPPRLRVAGEGREGGCEPADRLIDRDQPLRQPHTHHHFGRLTEAEPDRKPTADRTTTTISACGATPVPAQVIVTVAHLFDWHVLSRI